ncbi:DUF2804 family protein, partial [Acinetobacter rudis]
SGVNESYGNENALWINGVLWPLTDILFEQIDEHTWSISSMDQTLQLKVETGWRRFESLNLRLVGSQFSQWQARISGTIRPMDCEQSIELNAEYGVLEQHYAKW